MTAKQLFQAGQLNEAIKALGAEVRDNPADPRRRTFLFELLCFAGEYDRAEKHLHVLAQGNSQAEMGAVLYFSALHAERTRLEKFRTKPTFDIGAGAAVLRHPERAGFRVDRRCRSAHRRQGSKFSRPARTCGFRSSILCRSKCRPRRSCGICSGFRRWCARVHHSRTRNWEKFWSRFCIPSRLPIQNDNVRLGRETHWQEVEGGEPIPVGQKVFLVDGEEFPLLEVRKIEFTAQESAAA